MTKLFVASGASLALATGLGLATLAQQSKADVQVQAPGVQVDARAPDAEEAAPAAAEQAAPSYWIGVLGGPVSPELRSHLGLEGAGVLVREVVPDSPAAEAGLQQYDVLLTANGKPVTDMSILAGAVGEVGGKQDGKITLDLLRTGAHQQLTIVPAERPQMPAGNLGPNEQGPLGELPNDPQALLNQFFQGQPGGPLGVRVFGPGAAEGGANIAVQGPGATSVAVQTQNGKTHVTVNHNGKQYEVDSDDPESLEQLPPEVRPMVENALNGGAAGVNVDIDLNEIIPQIGGLLEGFGERRGDRRDDRLRQRIETLQRQLDQLRSRLGEAEAADQPAANGNEAPAFVPPPAPAAEIELPAVEN